MVLIGKNKIKIHLITNSYDLAVWEIQYYQTHPQKNRKTNKIIREPTWIIQPIKLVNCF